MVRRKDMENACSFEILRPSTPVACTLSKVVDPGPAPSGAVAFFMRRLHILGQ